MKDVHFMSLHEAAELIKSQKISPVTLVEACLARIERHNSATNAFITVLADEAREQAKKAEAEIKGGTYRGQLHGIPVAFKDMYDTEGIKTTAGFKYFKNRVPKEDAAVVKKLKEAGAIVIGKTNMHELAMGTTSLVSAFGPVHNPWNPDYIAGGSSGGSAVAIALGMCFATVDTDAIGSCRLPASCCGVVGYKCTWGLIDNSGVLAGERTDETILKLAAVGIMAREAADIAIVADALVVSDKKYTDKLKKKPEQVVGIVTNFGATEQVRKQFEQAVSELKKLGFKTVEVTAPFSENPDMQGMDLARKTVDKDIFSKVDVLVLPTTATEVLESKAAGKDAQALSPQNTFFVNYYGLPAISVPCGFDANGLPLGLQIVGRTDEDCNVMQVADAYQQATRWTHEHPHDTALPAPSKGLLGSIFGRK